MADETWAAVDDYVAGLLAPHDEALERAVRASEDAGLPSIQVSPPQGKLLHLLAKAVGAKAILEFGTLGYFAWALERSRPGSLIVADNVVRGGTLAEADSDDPVTAAQRLLHEQIAADPRVSATTIQTVGTKGHDGFTLALVGE